MTGGEYWYYFNSSGKLIYDGELKISGETYILTTAEEC